MARRLLGELDKFVAALNDGSDVSEESVQELMRRIESSVEEMSDDEIRSLDKAIRRLEQVARDRYEEMGEELRRLNYGRQALRGYNHLRGIDSCQRLYRRA